MARGKGDGVTGEDERHPYEREFENVFVYRNRNRKKKRSNFQKKILKRSNIITKIRYVFCTL